MKKRILVVAAALTALQHGDFMAVVFTAAVFIDGSYVGTTHENQTMHLRPGNYTIEIRAGNSTPFSQSVYVAAGKTCTCIQNYNGSVPDIPIGTQGETKLLVTPELCINFLGVEHGRVFGTPWLIWHMELTARDSVKAFLGDGFDTVGTHVDVRHLAATPPGMEVRFRSEVTGVEDRRIRFKVEAFDAKEKVGEGFHERGIIQIDRFAARVQAKAAEFQR